jgi:peptide-methionine (S)-S-oxide reductase
MINSMFQRLALLTLALVLFAAAAPAQQHAIATFAGGCFWCEESAYEGVKGVVSVTSGYTGGIAKNPTYEEVSSGSTGHRESVEVVYDPRVVTYQQLLDIFWHNVDPFDNSGQFCDHGSQYRGAIFVHDAQQRAAAEASKAAVVKRFGKPVVTDIFPASQFWPAEDYHQDYYKKNPVRYRIYRFNCGRDERLKDIWGAAPTH